MINQQEHILLCLSSSTSNPDVIKMAAAVAHENKAIFTALYVETPDNSKLVRMIAKDSNIILIWLES